MMQRPKPTQKGAALLLAMLTAALVAMLASASLWQQWRSVSVETAERGSQQAHWLLVGAQDWARVVLREDGRNAGADHLAEPWALPLTDARLSDFLAASPAGVVENADSLMDQVVLSGRITDMQSRLNLRNLVVNGELVDSEWQAWFRLYQSLGLPQVELQAWSKAYKASQALVFEGDAPLAPQRLEQLSWLGMSRASMAKLAPHISLLPVTTPVNINTASAQVLAAVVPGLSISNAQQWIAKRDTQAWNSLEEAQIKLGASAAGLNPKQHSVNSGFFEVIGQLRFDTVTLIEKSLVRRTEMDSRTVWQERRPSRSEPGCMVTVAEPC